MEPDASGTYIGSSYSYGSARDFARFGLLYLNNGKWNGEQILPEDWVQQTTQPVVTTEKNRYGYQFWLNSYTENGKKMKVFPDAPDDLFYPSGYGGQHVYIMPSKDLIVVRMGLFEIDQNSFLREIIKSIR
jgi:CubicO group peptidase (beta-lactamase class C family)